MRNLSPKSIDVLTSLFKKLLARKPFKKRLDRKPLPDRKLQEGLIENHC
ncbi:MAG TPA: hypothetical protein HA262_09400 [Methanosarcina sp.]|nr:hypothetical protein [Methanosarcina sp.]